MSTLEGALAQLEAQVGEAQKSAKALNAALAKIKAAVQTGTIAEIERGLEAIGRRGRETVECAARLPDFWKFDARAYLTEGFAEELRAAASAAGLEIIDRDGRLSMFPVLIQIEPKDLGVRVGKRIERRLRPSVLARLLADIQKKPQRFREQGFLDLLYRTYKHLCGAKWDAKGGLGPLKPLADLHAVLTLLPASDYSLQEFGRDLLLLDRRPELRTRDGARLQFENAAIARERVPQINVYDEHGMRHVYIALRFVKEG